MPAEFIFGPAPNEEAIDFLKSKPVVSREVFDALLPDLKARAFTIAGVESANVTQSIRDRLADLPAGVPWNTIKKDIADQLHPYLANPKDPDNRVAAERRAELLLRTHGFQAYSAAAYEVGERQADVFPYLQYVTMEDAKVRPTHAALDGVVLPRNHEFWKTHTPPWDWGCRCQTIPISEDDKADIEKADAKKAPDNRRVLTIAAQNELTGSRRLPRNGVTYNMTSPAETRKPGAFIWHPGNLRIPLEQLRSHYTAETWSEFERFARAHSAGGGKSVWEWLKGAAASILPKPAPAGPVRQSPVSAALDVVARGPVKKQITHAITKIDETHDDGALPQIRVDGSVSPGALGEFEPNIFRKKCRIGVSARGTWVELTTCHEAGHGLDHFALGKPWEYASVAHPDLAAWRAAVAKSNAVTAIRNGNHPKRSYYLKPQEIWARSYAQFVATRSKDPAMLAGLVKIRKSSAPWRQWEEADFAPIAAEIEALFKKKGWL